MQKYPLTFSVSPLLSSDRIQVKDASKNTLFILPVEDDAMKNGQKPYLIYSDRDKKAIAWQMRVTKVSGGPNNEEETAVFILSTAQGDPLGKVVAKDAGWEIQDHGGIAVGFIREKGAEKSCLGFLLSVMDLLELVFFLISPHRYEVEWDNQPVFKLQQADYHLRDVYRLKKHGEFFEAGESLLLGSLTAVLLA
jgi:hypothetical protein